MITQIMVNFLDNFYQMIQSVSVPNLKSFGQMKAELWAKSFGDLESFLQIQQKDLIKLSPKTSKLQSCVTDLTVYVYCADAMPRMIVLMRWI